MGLGEGRSVSEEVLKDLESVRKYYKPTRCYLISEGGEVEFPCEELGNHLTREGLISEGIKVCNERSGNCISLGRGEELRVVEFRGAEIYVSKDDAERVGRWEKIGYLITGGGGVRVLKVPFEGDIVLIQEIPEGRSQRLRIYVRVR